MKGKLSQLGFKNMLKKISVPGIAYGIGFLILLFGLLTSWRNVSAANLLLIARNSSILLLASIGMTMAILVSQVDLSIGSVMSLAGVIAAVCLKGDIGIPIAILLGLLSGMLIGLFNGIMVAVYKFDYWITTFATMGIGAGLALVVADGATVPISNRFFNWIGNGKIAGIYVMIWITVVVTVTVYFLLKKTRFGYNIYSVGGSEQAANLSGINVVKNRILVYVCSGFFAATAGLLLAAMGSSANPIGGTNYSFDAMAAVIIGGTGFDGGKGGIAGTVMGAIMLRVLSNGLGIMGIDATWQKTIIGFVIVTVLVVDAFNEKRRKTNEQRRVYAHE
ncbi:MAG TPA: ABC transporter permease [Firmicutes bacterium]|nr:ABC transporter permease [Bacillota bacterium]